MSKFFAGAITSHNDSVCGNELDLGEKADQELTCYKQEKTLAIDMYPLRWWQAQALKYPLISKVAKQYMSVQATSVASERVFSVAGDVVTAKRSQLSPDNVDRLLFLKKNLEI